MLAALDDDAHVAEQQARYAARRAVLRPALEAGRASASTTPRPGSTCGPRADEPAAGTPSTGWPSRGILVAPGDFYGPAGAGHVRIALTATDERVEAAAARLA